ncbi:serine/threonine-protein phosphatase 7 long form homolog [Arachis hypogaea]|uniref:serine/threonine-protein phosphatase 7 long form homolog n=1 Tax=Arachis hypogaea TaxID=3818 RepID=UPI003B22491D
MEQGARDGAVMMQSGPAEMDSDEAVTMVVGGCWLGAWDDGENAETNETGSNYAVHFMRSPSDALGACGGSRACDLMTDMFRTCRWQELLGVIPPPSQVQKYAVNCSWFQETFGECPEDADDDIVHRYAHAYIMMLLGTQLFADKSGNRIHIRWLPYVARLEELGTYSWGSAALAWLYQCMCRVANRHVIKLAARFSYFSLGSFGAFLGLGLHDMRRSAGRWPRGTILGLLFFNLTYITAWSGYNPSGSEKGPRVQMWRLRIDRLQDREFIWMPYSSPDVLQVVHPEVLEPRHMALWRSVIALIYFDVIEWHQIDRVLPQFGGVQPPPYLALNIDFLMSKDGRGGDRWFPSYLQKWHLHWDTRQESVLRFDVVANPGPSHEFLEWWSQHGKRFLSLDT